MDCEFSPGRWSPSARESVSSSSARDPDDVSGVSSDCEREDKEGAADFEFERKSDVDDGVDGEGVTGYTDDCDGCGVVPRRLGENIGRSGPWTSCVKYGEFLRPRLRPRPKLGVGLRAAARVSSLSAFRTRVHRCFQMSSDNRGPGSSASVSCISETEGVGLGCALDAEDKYRIIPAVLGNAYSLAIAIIWD